MPRPRATDGWTDGWVSGTVAQCTVPRGAEAMGGDGSARTTSNKAIGDDMAAATQPPG